MGNIFSALEKLKIIEKSSLQSDVSVTEEKEELSNYTEIKEELSNLSHSTINTETENINESEYKECKVNFMDKILQTNEIYNKSNIEKNDINTVFIINSFIKALPENLPVEIKRQSVLNIIIASGMNLENLIEDGNNRLSILNTYINEFSKETENTIIQYQMEIENLNKKIDEYKNNIKTRDKLQQEQNAIITYEIQKIEEIIGFINK